MMNYATSISPRNHDMFSYHPMPFYDDMNNHTSNKKLDLNLYCIKRPKQTCFIQVTNPNLLAWGIELDDLIIVEKRESLVIGDLVVMEKDQQFHIYEFATYNNDEVIFLALDSKMENIKTKDYAHLPIIGVVTNTVHQIKPKNQNTARVQFAA